MSLVKYSIRNIPFLKFFFRDRISLCNGPSCSRTHFVDQAGLELRDLPASASQVLQLKACATTAGQLVPHNISSPLCNMYWWCLLEFIIGLKSQFPPPSPRLMSHYSLNILVLRSPDVSLYSYVLLFPNSFLNERIIIFTLYRKAYRVLLVITAWSWSFPRVAVVPLHKKKPRCSHLAYMRVVGSSASDSVREQS